MSYKIEIDAPEVRYPGGTSHADFLRSAAKNLSGGFPVGGSNVTNTVINLLHSVADAMDEQRPRIPEPGLWGVVETTFKDGRSRHGWAVRRLTDGDADWQDGSGDYHRWDDLIDPTLIREGVQA